MIRVFWVTLLLACLVGWHLAFVLLIPVQVHTLQVCVSASVCG